ncbi:DUF5655 domain-containing protein [Roseateles toxinivorans]|uniref:Uncharacterized protein DUF4287 n=1 Tax=Roseateles toxinivorans TaxID=270368 RepID=A0A4R6QDP9_9BURK|nr:DUF5655 domain-containing protein [Roseateles toxinivorans]TDP59559.1 uncharacterized protein DUF4287 [Roseateles toxinivorans]
MSDPNAALQTQLRNIETKTGHNLASFRQLLAASGLAKHGEKRNLLMQTLGLGYGDANTVVTLASQDPTPAAEADPLDAIYTGPKAHLRPLHEAVIAAINAFGPYEIAPKKANVSLRRKKQFATLGPATKDVLELGLNVKQLPIHARLKVIPPGGMCQYSTRLGRPEDIDADLLAWLRAAFDAAG